MKAGSEITPEAAPVAFAGVVITPDGDVRTTACLVEPEHVPAIVEELTALSAKLLAFARSRSADVMTIALVILCIAVVDASLWPAMAANP